MNQRGFTVIELLFVTLLLIVVGVVFWTQKNNIEVAGRDDHRKQDVNTLYYAIEKVYYPTHKNYPAALTDKSLTSLDKNVFKDPQGIAIGKSGSDYRYEGVDCTNDACKSYTLRADLENEKDFVKKSASK